MDSREPTKSGRILHLLRNYEIWLDYSESWDNTCSCCLGLGLNWCVG